MWARLHAERMDLVILWVCYTVNCYMVLRSFNSMIVCAWKTDINAAILSLPRKLTVTLNCSLHLYFFSFFVVALGMAFFDSIFFLFAFTTLCSLTTRILFVYHFQLQLFRILSNSFSFLSLLFITLISFPLNNKIPSVKTLFFMYGLCFEKWEISRTIVK